MMITEDEERLLKNYRHVKEECERMQSSGWSTPACAFSVKGGTYVVCLHGEYVKEG